MGAFTFGILKKFNFTISKVILSFISYHFSAHLISQTLFFFPIYLNILFFTISHSLPFPLFLPLPLASATTNKIKNIATIMPSTDALPPHISQYHPPDHQTKTKTTLKKKKTHQTISSNLEEPTPPRNPQSPPIQTHQSPSRNPPISTDLNPRHHLTHDTSIHLSKPIT